MSKLASFAAMAILLASSTAYAQSAADRQLTIEQKKAVDAGKQRIGSLRVSAWVDRKDATYARGESLKLFVKSNEDVHVKIWNIGPGQPAQVTQLFPNKFQKSDLIKANRTTEIAGHKYQARIAVAKSGPVGAEVIKVIASTKPIEEVTPASIAASQGPFFVIKGGVSELVRGLEIVTEKPAPDEKVALVALKIKTVDERQ
jgi:hypothetical protein